MEIPEGKTPSRRPRWRWEDNIKMDLKEVGCDARSWKDLAQDQDQWRDYVRAIMNLWVPLKSISRLVCGEKPINPET